MFFNCFTSLINFLRKHYDKLKSYIKSKFKRKITSKIKKNQNQMEN